MSERPLSPESGEWNAMRPKPLLPMWVRAPKTGPEHYTGVTRPTLYLWAAAGHIRSVSIRQPGKLRGMRLFELASILEYIEMKEKEALGQ